MDTNGTAAVQALVNPLKGLNKAQTKQLAQVIARLAKANAARDEAQAKMKDSRMIVKAGLSPEQTTANVAAYKVAEKLLEGAEETRGKIAASLDAKPLIKAALDSYGKLQAAAAAGNVNAKSLLDEVATDFTLATATVAKTTRPAKRAAQEESMVESMLNGIGAGKVARKEMREGELNEDAKATVEETRKKRVPNELQEPALYPKTLPARYTVRGKEVIDKRTEQVAFVDKGKELRTSGDPDRDVVNLMIETAETRGWTPIRVFGAEAFKSMVWMQAASQGLSVVGYTPTKEELALAEQNRKINGKENGVAAGNPEKAVEEVLSKGQQLAKAFSEATTAKMQRQVTKDFPELAKAFALVKVFEKNAITSGMSAKDAKDFSEQFRDGLAERLENGKSLPTIEVVDRQQELHAGREGNDHER